MKTSGGKWKDALLKSSLPLELIVAEQLTRAGVHVLGEFPYSRSNDQGVRTEFSVDIHAGEYVPPLFEGTWGQSSFLIECKYNYPGVRWVFAPTSNEPWPRGFINIVQDFCLSRVDPPTAAPVGASLPVCIKGVELHEENANPQSIARALHQVRFGMVQLHAAALRRQLEAVDHVWAFVQFLCPIIVTTASLNVLRGGLNLNDYRNANSLDDLSDEVPSLIVLQESGPDLRAYIDDVHGHLLEAHPYIEQRIKEQAFAFTQAGIPPYQLPGMARLKAHFHESTQRVLIINVSSLPLMITEIQEYIREIGTSLRHYGMVVRDSNGALRIVSAQ